MQVHDRTLTIVGGAMLSTCLIVGGIASVAGNLRGEIPAEVLGVDGVTGASGPASDKSKNLPAAPAESEPSTDGEAVEQGADAATDGDTSAPRRSSSREAVRVPPAAPVPTAPQAQAAPQTRPDAGTGARTPEPAGGPQVDAGKVDQGAAGHDGDRGVRGDTPAPKPAPAPQPAPAPEPQPAPPAPAPAPPAHEPQHPGIGKGGNSPGAPWGRPGGHGHGHDGRGWGDRDDRGDRDRGDRGWGDRGERGQDWGHKRGGGRG